ncbi:serine/threonine-protein kinase [Lujinxingia litoralis]|uniref:serine/threonine-protein kinase n=1 Tax=Lujinxingia litoralis TaxID=2211119 RepID=UPI0011B93D9F|nr:serine/threonine-protein kinase [Lujinxingia litoralis]
MSSAAPQLPRVGDLIAGRYRVVKELGRGGYGVVFQARQEAIARDVAIKCLHPEVAHHEREVERFRREVFHASGLHHDHTITFFDYGQTPRGLLYVVMELLIGENLRDHVHRCGPLAPVQGRQLLEQLLGSLEEAHSRQLIHRDLKPENIFVNDVPQGAPLSIKVLDFGLSKFIGDPGATLYRGPSLTADGEVCGTPQYMSPEHAYGEPVGPPGDIYAVGLLLYEALVGRPAFDGPTPLDILLKQVKAPLPTLPEAIARTTVGRFITRATHKEIGGRFADAGRALSWLLSQEDRPEETSGARPALVGLARSARRTLAPEALPESTHADPPEPPSPRPVDNDTLREVPAAATAPTELQLEPAPAAPLHAFEKRVASLPLLGRHRALDALTHWHAKASLHGGIFLLTGDSGQGKSALLQTWLTHLPAPPGARTLRGRYRRHGEPLAGLRQALSPLLAPDEPPREHSTRLDHSLQALSTCAADSRTTLKTHAVHPLHQVVHALHAISEQHALLLVLEDVQYADPLSRQVLDQLLEMLTQHPRPIALILCARSPRHVKRWHSPASVSAARHHLAPLPNAAMRELLASVLPASSVLQRDLLDLAGGNPALLLHLIRHLLETHQIRPRKPGAIYELSDPSVALSSLVPPDLRELVITRANRLLQNHPEEARLRALLHRAVLFGDRFEGATLARAIFADGQPELARQCGELLEALCAIGLLRRDGGTDAPVHFAFVQPLHRASLVRMVESIDDWRTFHGHAARARIERHGEPDASECEAIAEHLERSSQSERALPWWLRAAAEAEGEHRLHEALRLLRRAEPQILHTRQVDHTSLSALRLQQGRLYHLAGEFGPGEDALREAIIHAESADHVANEAHAREHLADVVRLQGRLDEAEALLQRTSELCVILEDRAGLRRVLLGQADLARFRGRYARARADLEMVHEAASREGDPAAAIAATLALSRCAYASGELREAWSLVGKAITQARTGGDHRAHALALIEASHICMIVDGLERSEALARQAMNAARQHGDILAQANANLSLALCLRRTTHLDRSAAHLRRARELHERLGHLYGVAKDLLLEAELCWLRGDTERAQRLADDSLQLHQDLDDRHGWALSTIYRALFRIEQGQPARALELLQDVFDLEDILGLGLYAPQLLFYAGMAWEAQANIDEAREYYTRAQHRAQEMGHREMISLSTISLVKLDLVQGDIDSARFRLPEARRQAERTGHAYSNMFVLLGTALLAHIDDDRPALRAALARLRPYLSVPNAPDLRLEKRLGDMRRLLTTLPPSPRRRLLDQALETIVETLTRD